MRDGRRPLRKPPPPGGRPRTGIFPLGLCLQRGLTITREPDMPAPHRAPRQNGPAPGLISEPGSRPCRLLVTRNSSVDGAERSGDANRAHHRPPPRARLKAQSITGVRRDREPAQQTRRAGRRRHICDAAGSRERALLAAAGRE